MKTRPAGFEPATYGLEIRCSIQLSYERNIFFYNRLQVFPVQIKFFNYNLDYYILTFEFMVQSIPF